MHAAAEMWVSEGALLFTIFINDQKKEMKWGERICVCHQSIQA